MKGISKPGVHLEFDYGIQPDMKVADRHILFDKEEGVYKMLQTGVIDLYEITQSHADEVGIDNILARMALGDLSMLRDPEGNLGDVSGVPTDPHELQQMAASGSAAVQVLTDLGLTDEEGNKLSGYEIAGMEKDQLLKVLSRKVAAEAPKEETING